jgi:hypothetical protein
LPSSTAHPPAAAPCSGWTTARWSAALEERAAADGFVAVRLETGLRQPEALRLYGAAGYARTPAYGPYVGNPLSVCFAKELNGQV